MALSAGTQTPNLASPSPMPRTAPQKTATTIYQHGLVMIDSTGYLLPGAASASSYGAGRAKSNGGTDRWAVGGSSADDVDFEVGIFGWKNSASGDEVLETDIGKVVYIVDDETVAKTSRAGSLSPAGIVVQVSGGRVFVLMSPEIGKAALTYQAAFVPVTMHVMLSLASSEAVVGRVMPPFPGELIRMDAMVVRAVTTASKSAIFRPSISTVAVSGGTLSTTSASLTPLGARITGSSVSGLNSFNGSQEIVVDVSAATTYGEGEALLFLFLKRI